MGEERIFYFGRKEDGGGPAGETGSWGPCSEIFFDTGKEKCGKNSKLGCKCGKYFEIWNDVIMTYDKEKNGEYALLKQKNVDTGMGVERTTALLQGKKNVYDIEEFAELMKKIKQMSGNYDEKKGRIIADHITAAVFILGDEHGIVPSNLGQGYVLRRLIRSAVRNGGLIGIKDDFCTSIARAVISSREENYPILKKKERFVLGELRKEERRFKNGLSKGLRQFNKITGKRISGKQAFVLFSSYGFPIEMTTELANEKGMTIDIGGFEREFKKHQKISRVGAERKFKSGLADNSEEVKRLHTATHLLHAALKKVLGGDVEQRGSNITKERLRFDFNFGRKLRVGEIKKIENLVNNWIRRGLDIKREEMSISEAKKRGAIGLFDEKYGEKVSVYTINNISKEICAGPHVKNTGELGRFRIVKEESSSAGVRRIKAKLFQKNLWNQKLSEKPK